MYSHNKIKLLLPLLLIGTFLRAQTPIQVTRNNGVVTAVDYNLFTKNSLKIPVFADTASALAHAAIDSIGLMFKEYGSSKIWIRDSNLVVPGHKWTLVGTGGGSAFDSLTAQGGVFHTGSYNDSKYRLVLDTIYAHLLMTRAWGYKISDSVVADYISRLSAKRDITDTSYAHLLMTRAGGYKISDSLNAALRGALVANALGTQFLGYGIYASHPTSGTGIYIASDSIPTGAFFYDNAGAMTNLTPSISLSIRGKGGPGDTAMVTLSGSLLTGFNINIAAIRDSAGSCVKHVFNPDGSMTLYSTCGGGGALTSGDIFVGNVSNAATDVAMSGDVHISNTGATTIQSNVVSNSKLAQMTAHTYKGNNTGSTANAADITSTQLTADLNQFTASLQGMVPGSAGGTTNFLRADGTWAAPAGGGGGNTNSNVGSAFRLAIPSTNNIKTLGDTYAVLLDSITTNQIGLSVDTTLVVAKAGAQTVTGAKTFTATTAVNAAFSTNSTVNLTGLTGTSGGASFKVVTEDTSSGKLWNIPYYPIDTTGYAAGKTLAAFNGTKFVLGLVPSNNGLYDSASTVQLGEPIGQSGNPAQLFSNREVPMWGKKLVFLDSLNNSTVKSSFIVGDTTNTLSQGWTPAKLIQRGNGDTTTAGNGGYFMTFEPANYGRRYKSFYAPFYSDSTLQMDRWYSSYVLAANNDGTFFGGLPDAVIDYISYNEHNGANRINSRDGAWRFGAEGNYLGSIGSPTPNLDFEFHVPAVTTFNGHEYRTNSFYVNKTTGVALNNLTVENQVFYAALNNTLAQDTPYIQFTGLAHPNASGAMYFFGYNGSSHHAGEINFQNETGGQFQIGSFGTGDGFFTSNFTRTPSFGMLQNGDLLLNQNNDLSNSSGHTIVGNLDYNGANIKASAQFQVFSTNRGSLPAPVMTKAQFNSISAKDSGLLATLSDSGYRVGMWNGTKIVTYATTDMLGTGGASNYQTVQSNGSSQTQRAKLNFKSGFQVADNSGNGSTDVTATPIVFSQTAASSAITSSAGSLFGTGTGSLTIPANALLAGQTITIHGFLSVSSAASPGAISINPLIGGNGWSSGFTPANSLTNSAVEFVITWKIITTGSSGTTLGTMSFYPNNALPQISINSGTTTINTTITLALDIQGAWGSFASGDSMNSVISEVKIQ